MKIIAVSDTHGKTPILPKGDVLVHCGDWSMAGTFQETMNFLTWLSSIRDNYKEILVIPGNHDRWVQQNEALAKEEFNNIGVKLLIDELVTIDGIRFYGHPWTPMFCNWSYMLYEDEMIEKCAAIPAHDVLLSHGPPSGFLDEVERFNGQKCEYEIEHVGCQSLYDTIDRLRPKIVFCGHIHEGYGQAGFKGIDIYNVSHMDGRYRARNKYVEVEYIP